MVAASTYNIAVVYIENSVKLKFHWDQFPRNFPVTNVTGKSPTSYEEVGDVANKSARKLRGNWSQWNLSMLV